LGLNILLILRNGSTTNHSFRHPNNYPLDNNVDTSAFVFSLWQIENLVENCFFGMVDGMNLGSKKLSTVLAIDRGA